MEKGEGHLQRPAHAEREGTKRRTRGDKGLHRKGQASLLVDISLTRLLGRIRTRANLMKEELVDISIAVRLEGGLCEQELRIILSIEEVAGIALILIDDTHLTITLRAVAFLSEDLEDRRKDRGGSEGRSTPLQELIKEGYRQ